MRSPSASSSRRHVPATAPLPTAASPATEPTSWVVEQYWPGLTRELFRTAAARVRQTAEAMTRDGTPVRCRHSTLVPADEAAFSVIDAASLEVVQALYLRAGVRFDRILTAEEV